MSQWNNTPFCSCACGISCTVFSKGMHEMLSSSLNATISEPYYNFSSTEQQSHTFTIDCNPSVLTNIRATQDYVPSGGSSKQWNQLFDGPIISLYVYQPPTTFTRDNAQLGIFTITWDFVYSGPCTNKAKTLMNDWIASDCAIVSGDFGEKKYVSQLNLSRTTAGSVERMRGRLEVMKSGASRKGMLRCGDNMFSLYTEKDATNRYPSFRGQYMKNMLSGIKDGLIREQASNVIRSSVAFGSVDNKTDDFSVTTVAAKNDLISLFETNTMINGTYFDATDSIGARVTSNDEYGIFSVPDGNNILADVFVRDTTTVEPGIYCSCSSYVPRNDISVVYYPDSTKCLVAASSSDVFTMVVPFYRYWDSVSFPSAKDTNAMQTFSFNRVIALVGQAVPEKGAKDTDCTQVTGFDTGDMVAEGTYNQTARTMKAVDGPLSCCIKNSMPVTIPPEVEKFDEIKGKYTQLMRDQAQEDGLFQSIISWGKSKLASIGRAAVQAFAEGEENSMKNFTFVGVGGSIGKGIRGGTLGAAENTYVVVEQNKKLDGPYVQM